MRKQFGILLLAFGGVVFGQSNLTSTPPRITPQERVQLKARQPQRIEIAQQFMQGEQTRQQLQAGTAFQVKTATLDAIGGLHVRLDQKYKGVRIPGAQVIIHMDRNDGVKGITGTPIRDLSLDTKPQVTESEAKEIVKLDFLPRGGEMDAETELVIYVQNDPAAVERQTVRSSALAWKVIATADEMTSMFYYVDAHAGRILLKESAEYAVEYSTKNGQGQSGRFTSNVSFSIAQAEPPPNPYTGPYRLLDPSRGNNKVVNMELKAASKNYSGLPYWSPDTHFGGPAHFKYETMSTWGPEGVGSGVDAAVGMQRLWNLLGNVFGQDGIDGNGKGMVARVHMRKKTGEPYTDAHWDGTYGNFGDRKTSSRTDLLTVGHEFGHALYQYMLGEDHFSGEASGLNEGHGDIAGTLVNIYHKEMNGSGSQLPTDVPLSLIKDRSVNPLGYSAGGQVGMQYYVQYMGLREVHTVGCAYGHAWVFLALGATPSFGDAMYSEMLPGGMVGIGIHKAAEIWYLALTGYMDSSPTFSEVRAAYIDAATDLYGANSAEVKAVQNAFFGIKVGGGAADVSNPTASLSNPVINESEQSAFVSMSAGDDVGVMTMELRLDGVQVKKVFGPGPKSWYGYVSLEGLGIGTHTLQVKATDAAGKHTETVKQFTLTGRNRLIKNGTFEAGVTNWARSSDAIFQSNNEASFLDSGYAMFGVPGQWIRQTVTIPASANAATLSYRIRSEKYPSVFPSEQLRVEVLNNSGVLLDVLGTHTNLTPLGDAPSNGYAHFSYGLAAYAGQTIQLRFLCVAAMPARFKLDNVSLVWSGPVDATLDVDVDEAEGSVIFQVNDIVNIPADQIKQVRLLINGASVHVWTSPPYILAISTNGLVKNANSTVKAEIRNINNTVVGTTEESNFIIHDVTNLLKSPDFEVNPSTHWGRTGGTTFGIDGGEAMLNFGFLGTRYVYMNGSPSTTQTLMQQVYLPGDADNITLGFRLKIASPQMDVNDLFMVRILNTNDQVIALPLALPAIVNTYQPGNPNGYMKIKLNLTNLKGQMVRIEFRSIHVGPKPTTFYIDNTSLVAKKMGLAFGN
ncbi:MAG: M4 family metallopeptidase [Acidobacteriota bacterium]